ncbi:hypothetical protein [Streptomyces sp. CoH17]|uniref:hypothetical protein n=1 Tax=Streptomyces sp. CoH17 TaxID=2992806 RepID=UPI00227068FF|nr:hypothetical protein [Streptomyces sp. CoH17]
MERPNTRRGDYDPAPKVNRPRDKFTVLEIVERRSERNIWSWFRRRESLMQSGWYQRYREYYAKRIREGASPEEARSYGIRMLKNEK